MPFNCCLLPSLPGLKEIANLVWAVYLNVATFLARADHREGEGGRCCGGTSGCTSAAQSGLTLCGPTDCSPPGSSIHGMLQAKILGRVFISSSRGSQGLNPCPLCLLQWQAYSLPPAPPWKPLFSIIQPQNLLEPGPAASVSAECSSVDISVGLKLLVHFTFLDTFKSLFLQIFFLLLSCFLANLSSFFWLYLFCSLNFLHFPPPLHDQSWLNLNSGSRLRKKNVEDSGTLSLVLWERRGLCKKNHTMHYISRSLVILVTQVLQSL